MRRVLKVSAVAVLAALGGGVMGCGDGDRDVYYRRGVVRQVGYERPYYGRDVHVQRRVYRDGYARPGATVYRGHISQPRARYRGNTWDGRYDTRSRVERRGWDGRGRWDGRREGRVYQK